MKHFLLFLFALPLVVFGEGTRELQRGREDRPCKLDILNPSLQSRFAAYNTNQDERLQFHVQDPGNEQVFLGFGIQWRGSTFFDSTRKATVFFRIKDPNGTVVYGPVRMRQTRGAGFIGNFNEANAGPKPLNATGAGYDPIVFQPTIAGDYYIEINPNDSLVEATGSDNNFKINWFDCTVANKTTNQAINGRVWAKTWDLSALLGNSPIITRFYVYTTDSIISRIDMNGMQPFGFSVRCNRNGLRQNSSFAESRRSDSSRGQYAEFKIFLNQPDPTVYPTGSIAQLGPLGATVTGCPAQGFLFNIDVTKNTYAEFWLELNNTPGFQPNSADRRFTAFLNKGSNTIPWDGIDGRGVLITLGRAFDLEGHLVTGLSNFPIYDAEYNPNGFIVDQISPSPTSPVGIFWDDTKLPGGTLQLTSPCVGACHNWRNARDSAVGKPANRGFGDERTINTWWEPFRTPFVSNYRATTCPEIVNRPPVGIPDTITWLDKCEPRQYDVMANNYDVDGQVDLTSLRLIRGSAFAGLTLDGNGKITVSPSCDTTNLTDTLIFNFCDVAQPPLCSNDTVILRYRYPVTPTPPTTRNVFIPTGFSPNKDGINDVFVIRGAERFKVTLTVYNRWGSAVFRSDDYKNDWDGKANSGLYLVNEELPVGTYFAVVNFNNGEKPVAKTITIKGN